MRILVACEESQVVCKAFRARGHEAYSCDIQDCSGGRPEWHIKGDALVTAKSQKWDMMIGHPVCTYLCNSGVSWLWDRKSGVRNYDRWGKMYAGALFFKDMFELDIEIIVLENPIMHKYAREIIGYGYDQIIHPYQFGHTERKATCLWIKGTHLLEETDNVKEEMLKLPKNQQQRLHYLPPGPERAKLRSKTFPGIGTAFAQQWG